MFPEVLASVLAGDRAASLVADVMSSVDREKYENLLRSVPVLRDSLARWRRQNAHAPEMLQDAIAVWQARLAPSFRKTFVEHFYASRLLTDERRLSIGIGIQFLQFLCRILFCRWLHLRRHVRLLPWPSLCPIRLNRSAVMNQYHLLQSQWLTRRRDNLWGKGCVGASNGELVGITRLDRCNPMFWDPIRKIQALSFCIVPCGVRKMPLASPYAGFLDLFPANALRSLVSCIKINIKISS